MFDTWWWSDESVILYLLHYWSKARFPWHQTHAYNYTPSVWIPYMSMSYTGVNPHTGLCHTPVWIPYMSMSYTGVNPHTGLCHTPVWIPYMSMSYIHVNPIHVYVIHPCESHTCLCHTPVWIPYMSMSYAGVNPIHVHVIHRCESHTCLCHTPCESHTCLCHTPCESSCLCHTLAWTLIPFYVIRHITWCPRLTTFRNIYFCMTSGLIDQYWVLSQPWIVP